MTGNPNAKQQPTAPFEEFVESPRGHRLLSDVRRIAGGNDGDDVVQEVLVWAWQRWDAFESEDHVVFACIRFARNRVVDRARRPDQRRVDLRDSFEAQALGVDDDPADTVVRLDECRDRWRAFRLLPATSQSLLLNRAEGATYDELAARFKLSAAASRVQVCRSRAAMRNALRPAALAAALVVPRWLFRSIRRRGAQVARGGGGGGALGPVASGAAGLATTALLALPGPGAAAAAPVAEARPVRPVAIVATGPERVAPRSVAPPKRDVPEPESPEECTEHCKETVADDAREVAQRVSSGIEDVARCARMEVEAPWLEVSAIQTRVDGTQYYDVRGSIDGAIPRGCPVGPSAFLRLANESPGHHGEPPDGTKSPPGSTVHVTDELRVPFVTHADVRVVTLLGVRVELTQDLIAAHSCRHYRYALVASLEGVKIVELDVRDCDASVIPGGVDRT